MNYQELWDKVAGDGEQTCSESGFGAEVGWTYWERELEVEGRLYQAAYYATEVRCAYDLYVFSESAESWTHIWGDWEQN